MPIDYNGFKLYAIPRNGGYIVRLRATGCNMPGHEAPFVETGVYRTENEAMIEGERLAQVLLPPHSYFESK